MEAAFPKLRTGAYDKTSEMDPGYNCIAWAAGDTTRFWWPRPERPYYWPDGLPRVATRQNFIDAFSTLGYSPSDSLDASIEQGLEKIALFEDTSGKPTHAARQLATGAWTSKLGVDIDIEHQDVAGVEGNAYGTLAVILVRKAEMRDLLTLRGSTAVATP